MRTSVLVAVLVSSAALLAGCADDGDHGAHTFTCPDSTVLDLEQYPDHDNESFDPLTKCPKTATGNTTASAPNVEPTLVLKVSDDGGNETSVTFVDGNLTFDATGSADPDGSITGIAVSVTDSNTTRTSTLYDAATKKFKTATFRFDRPGVVNVTVAMVDDRAGFTVNQTKVYVNEIINSAEQQLAAPAGLTGEVSHCSENVHPVFDPTVRKQYPFPVLPGATFVESTVHGEGTIKICSFDDQDLSEEGASVTTAPDASLPPAPGTDSYYVGAVATGPQATISVTTIIHYEPQEAAAA